MTRKLSDSLTLHFMIIRRLGKMNNGQQFVEVTNHWGSTKQKRRVRASPKNPSKITRMNEAVFQWLDFISASPSVFML